MPENLALYVLLVVALAVGFLLGRRESKRRTSASGLVSDDYLKGLNHLLNERHDMAIDTFVENMAVDSSTVDTHLALGSLVRRRGEVDKAIRLHQNLLARPVLSNAHRRQTELELARDYLAAGLLDRAENLLLALTGKLTGRKTEAQRTVLELLLDIYQQEKEWAKAIAIGHKLSRQDRGLRPQLAHFECELAAQALQGEKGEGDQKAAAEALARGAKLDAQCARVPFMLAEVAMSRQQYKDARRHLKKACELDPGLIAESLDAYRDASEALDQDQAYVDFLREGLEKAPSLRVLERLAAIVEHREGFEAAMTFRVNELAKHPSLGGVADLLDQLENPDHSLTSEQLQPLAGFVRALAERQPQYRCRHCGFGSKGLMWQCPSCRHWGSMKPVSPEDLS
jgi:lipopolysaccharide biosynthesis regulator YciM